MEKGGGVIRPDYDILNNIFKSGKWHVEYIAEDGGRICRLQYSGIDLLTRRSQEFIKPENDFGLYETRPVFGYDDCFPTVDSCIYPGSSWMIPDHGELCWLPWNIKQKDNVLECSVASQELPILFSRTMHFSDNQLVWKFHVENHGSSTLFFQHIMHPLMPLGEIIDINLPDFWKLYDEINDTTRSDISIDTLKMQLLNQKKGTASMFLLQGLKENSFDFSLKSGLKISVEFPLQHFSSLGIWWNNFGYPDEKNCRRCECAFEPISGNCSKLESVFDQNEALKVSPDSAFQWDIKWQL